MPIVGITADIIEAVPPSHARPKAGQAMTYLNAVVQAGGVPILLPPIPALAAQHARFCDAFIFTGGDDPAMEPLGGITHPAATTMHPQRQAYEFALLAALDHVPAAPVLGICLGMQMMSLHKGGQLDQHLPDTLTTAAGHRGDQQHTVRPVANIGAAAAPLPASAFAGHVTSNHHQGVSNPGTLRILARSDDGVIEAVDDPLRPFYLGVQWHPERTADTNLGAAIFARLIAACQLR